MGDVGEPGAGPSGRQAVPQRRLAGRRQRRAAGETSPTATVTAASPCQPSTIAPKSIEIRSPSRSTSARDGMPCTIRSLTEEQMTAGKPW